MTKDKKYMYVGIGLLLVTLILSGVTYAVLTWTSTKTNIGINTDCFTIEYSKGDNITGKLKLINWGDIYNDENNTFTIKEGMGMSYVNLGIKSTCNIEGYGSIYLNVTELSDTFKDGGDSFEALRYAVLKNTSDLEDNNLNITNLKEQSFEMLEENGITETGKIKIHQEMLSNTEVNKYMIIIYIDEDMAGNDVISATFKGGISAEAYQGIITLGNAIEYISSLYNGSTKIPVENNSITYQYDTDHNLMSDIANNVRYYGASPDNYIYFNCDTYPETNCELWRVVGVVDGKVKIMRNEYLPSLTWDNKNISSGAETDKGKNDWTDARLMTLLNPGYENDEVDNGLYWNRKSGRCYGTQNVVRSCDLSEIGIKNDKTRDLISESIWYLRGWDSTSSFADEGYNYERTTGSVYEGRKDTWKGKIALLSASDYGYATDFRNCTTGLKGGEYESIRNENCWISAMGWTWLLTPFSNSSYSVWMIGIGGYGSQYFYKSYMAIAVNPTLYLDPEIELLSGIGSEDDPYRIYV